MTATPLTNIQLPEQALTELRDVDVTEWIHDHAIAVGRPWWTQTLTAHGLDDTLTGETIRRADIFALADATRSSAGSSRKANACDAPRR